MVFFLVVDNEGKPFVACFLTPEKCTFPKPALESDGNSGRVDLRPFQGWESTLTVRIQREQYFALFRDNDELLFAAKQKKSFLSTPYLTLRSNWSSGRDQQLIGSILQFRRFCSCMWLVRLLHVPP